MNHQFLENNVNTAIDVKTTTFHHGHEAYRGTVSFGHLEAAFV